jgi:hypothetical protein
MNRTFISMLASPHWSPGQMNAVHIVTCYLFTIHLNAIHRSSTHACVCQVVPSLNICFAWVRGRIFMAMAQLDAVTAQYRNFRPLFSYSWRRCGQKIAPPWGPTRRNWEQLQVRNCQSVQQWTIRLQLTAELQISVNDLLHTDGLCFTSQNFSLGVIGAIKKNWLCGLVVRVLGYRSRDPGSIPSATRFSEK